jgi:hypothetical protein
MPVVNLTGRFLMSLTPTSATAGAAETSALLRYHTHMDLLCHVLFEFLPRMVGVNGLGQSSYVITYLSSDVLAECLL